MEDGWLLMSHSGGAIWCIAWQTLALGLLKRLQQPTNWRDADLLRRLAV